MADKGAKSSGDGKVFRRMSLPCVSMVAMLGVVGTLFVLWSYATFGDIRSGWFRLGGYHLIAEEYQIDLGTVSSGESKPGTFRLKNLTGEPVFILGIESDCSCLTTAELPIEVPGDKVFDLEVLFQADRVDSDTEVVRWIILNLVVRWIILNLSVDQPSRLLEFKARIVPNNEEKQDDP